MGYSEEILEHYKKTIEQSLKPNFMEHYVEAYNENSFFTNFINTKASDEFYGPAMDSTISNNVTIPEFDLSKIDDVLWKAKELNKPVDFSNASVEPNLPDIPKSREMTVDEANKVMDRLLEPVAENDLELSENERHMMWLISQVYNDLPTNRDWLDPNLETEMKTIKEKYERATTSSKKT